MYTPDGTAIEAGGCFSPLRWHATFPSLKDVSIILSGEIFTVSVT